MKRTITRVLAMLLAILLTLPLLASCGSGKAGNEENSLVTEVDGVTVTKEDGIPVYDQYKARVVDLGLSKKEKIFDIIEIDGELRATVGVEASDYNPEDRTKYIYYFVPYLTEHRWYSPDYVEDVSRREKTEVFHEITFPSDPNSEFVFGGDAADEEWDRRLCHGVIYHVYRNGESIDDGMLPSGYLPPEEAKSDTKPLGYCFFGHIMDCGGVAFVSSYLPFGDAEKIVARNPDSYGEYLYINGHEVDTRHWKPGEPHYTFHGLIGIRGEPYALLEINEKGRLIPLTAETTEITFDGIDIEGLPTGGAFDDGRFGYFMSASELWRTDGKESRCIAELAPYGVDATSSVRSVRALSDGRLLVPADGKLLELTASDGSDAVPVCDVGVLDYDAGLGNFSDFNLLVSKYNTQAEKSFVRVKEYRDANRLNLAMLSGDVDMVVTPNQFVLKNYIKQELLVALEEVAPALFEKDVLIESVVNAAKVDGICYYLPVNFDVCGEYIADPGLLKDEKTIKDRVAYYEFIKENDPEYFKANWVDKMLNNFINDLDEWIDWETSTCHFDDGTFAPLLELCALGCTAEEAWEHTVSKAPIGDWWSRDEKAGSFTLQDVVESYRFTDVASAQKFQKGLPVIKDRYAGPSTWVQVDFPMPSRVHDGYAIDPHNLYAIVDHKDSKEAAADFLQWVILEDVIEEFPEKDTADFLAKCWDGFPINKDETDRYLRRLIDGYVDPEEVVANLSPETRSQYPDTVAFERYWTQRYDARCGQSQYEITWDYIEKADHLRYADSELHRVIRNEANGFFTGAISAEKAADYIQNRISLYLAEQS